MEDSRREVLGVLGGLGPLASAEFLQTIYQCTLGATEQDAPAVVLYSDPAFPDRTTALLGGHTDVVLSRLVEALYRLLEMGATQMLICCVTAHHVLPELPAELQARIISIPRVITERLLHTRGRHLLVCTNGTRVLGLLEREPLWEQVRDRVIFPDGPDQDVIHHDLIYPIKRMAHPATVSPILDSLLDKYHADGFIVGCSEVHILAKYLLLRGTEPHGSIDPFLAIASRLNDRCHRHGDEVMAGPGRDRFIDLP